MVSSFDSLFTCEKKSTSDTNERPTKAVIDNSSNIIDDKFIDITAYPEEIQAVALIRHSWLTEIYRLNITSFTEQSLTEPLYQIHRILGGQKPNWRTIKRWHDSYQASSKSLVSLIPKSTSGNKSIKVPNVTEQLMQQTLDRLLCAEKPSIADGYRYLEEITYLHNKNTGTDLTPPSYEALRKRFKAIKPYNKMVAYQGKSKADQEFKKVGMIIKSSRVLERVEVDHTPIDAFVIDESSHLPLGRPYLTALIDHLTKSIIGYYIGFEPPSLVSVGYALKNAILPKTWLKTLYPEVKHDWCCSGVPEQLVVDNGSEFWSPIFDNMCLELNIDTKHNPVRKPWLKPHIERYFSTLNRNLFANIKGKSFSNIFERKDYDSQNTAVLTLSKLKTIIAIWVVDVYQQKSNNRKTNIPALSWRDAIKKFPPKKYDGTEQKLDFYLSHIDTRTLRKEGIIFNNLRYHSDELALMRAEHGNHRVQIKYTPKNLSFIYVLNRQEQNYIKVPAIYTEYTKELSLWSHKLHIKYVRHHVNENFDNNDLIEARIKIRNIVEEAVNEKKSKITGKKRASRYLEKDKDHNPSEINTVNTPQIQNQTKLEEDWDFEDDWIVVNNDA